jgi:hypothetical protein
MLLELSVAALIMSACVVIHITGLLTLVDRLLRQKHWIKQNVGFRHYTPLLTFIFAVVTGLHILEACIWAVFYDWHRLFPNAETALYFSLGSYTTIGYGDVVLPEKWRLLGTLEGITGVLLCGLSTAFIFAVVNALFKIRVQQLNQAAK